MCGCSAQNRARIRSCKRWFRSTRSTKQQQILSNEETNTWKIIYSWYKVFCLYIFICTHSLFLNNINNTSPLNTGRNVNVHKAFKRSRTSSDHLMYIHFTLYVQGVVKDIHRNKLTFPNLPMFEMALGLKLYLRKDSMAGIHSDLLWFYDFL